MQESKPWLLSEQYSTVEKVKPSSKNGLPQDAIILFDGSTLNTWQTPQFPIVASMEQFEAIIPQLDTSFSGNPIEWKIVDNSVLEVVPGKGAIATKQSFGNIQLHIEWKSPIDEGKKGQKYSNSGIFLMGLYEIQVLNSYQNDTYSNGQAGAIYKQYPPMVNASKPAGEWQSYDIIFEAPIFDNKGKIVKKPIITAIHNGVLIHHAVKLNGPTTYIGTPYMIPHVSKLPIILQDHGDKVQFRNIWLREI